MPIVNCPFHIISPGELPRPMLPVRITNPRTGLFLDAWGLIDTGADDCALPATFAPLLGHKLNAGLRKNISTGNGTTCAYAHTTRIDIFSIPIISVSNTIAYTIPDTPMDFLPNLGCILLGTTSFLSNFILHINYPKQFFSIRKP